MTPRRAALLSDRKVFRDWVAARAGVRRVGSFAECGSVAALDAELGSASDPCAFVVIDLEHRRDDPLAAIRDLRARWPSLVIAAVSGAPSEASGDVFDALFDSDARRHGAADSGNVYGGIWEGLTQRQRQVLAHLGEGDDNLKIAACLGVSERAVKAHVSALLHAFAAENRTQLGILASHAGSRDRR